jgi:hypothetical protein
MAVAGFASWQPDNQCANDAREEVRKQIVNGSASSALHFCLIQHVYGQFRFHSRARKECPEFAKEPDQHVRDAA